MLERVSAVEFLRAVSNGRTQPCHLVCEKADGSAVELIVKFSAYCEEGVVHLAREVIAACLAGDLGLPVPKPYLVEISPAFANIVPDQARSAKIKASAPVAFGSTFATGQYSTWVAGTRITEALLPMATAIFAFDAIIQNPDRREVNANCLVQGDKCRIFDHELCFAHHQVLSWIPPWVLNGLNPMTTPGYHIFRAGLRGRMPDFGAIRRQWAGLSDARLLAYESAIPAEWVTAAASVKAALQLIRDARDNIDGCINEMKRVLK